MKKLFLSLVSCSILLCAQNNTIDLSTPEKAVLSLEEAYRQKDIEMAIACKDFYLEAKEMVSQLSEEIRNDTTIIKKATEVLELGFRHEIKTKGFPNFHNVQSSFVKRDYSADSTRVVLTERCMYSDGGKSEERLLVVKSGKVWKVLNVVEK